jgi:hypothetical protein
LNSAQDCFISRLYVGYSTKMTFLIKMPIFFLPCLVHVLPILSLICPNCIADVHDNAIFYGLMIRALRPNKMIFIEADRPTQLPVQWIPGLSRGVRWGRGVTLTPHPLLVPKSKIEYNCTSTIPKGLCGL